MCATFLPAEEWSGVSKNGCRAEHLINFMCQISPIFIIIIFLYIYL